MATWPPPQPPSPFGPPPPSPFGTTTRDPFARPAPRPAPRPPAAAAGRPPDAAASSFWRLSVGARQRILRDAGYNVTLDGQPGPQTFTASKAYIKGIPAAYWNRAWAHNHPAHPAGGVASTDASSSGPAPRGPATAAPASKPTTASSWGDLVMQILQQALSPAAGPSQADLMKGANTYADASLAPYRAELERQRTEALTDARNRADFQKRAAGALAQVLGGIAPTVQGAYHEATTDTGALAQGFSDGYRASAQKSAGDVNQTLDMIGAPDAQKLTAEKGNAGGDVLYGVEGYIPGSALAREGAAFTSAAAMLPQTAVGQGLRQAQAELATGTEASKQLNAQLLDLALRKPELVQTYLQQAKQDAAQQAALQQERALIPLTLAGKLEGFPGVNPITGMPTKTQTGLQIQVGNQKIRIAQLDLSTRRAIASITGVDPVTGNLTPEGQRILIAQYKATHPPKKGGFTAAKLQELQATAADTAAEAFTGWTQTLPDKSTQWHPPKSYQEAMRDLLRHGIPLALAQKALNGYWTRPGYDLKFDPKDGTFLGWVKSSAGRPLRPFQVRVRPRTTRR